MSKATEKKSNPNKAINTQKRKAARAERAARRREKGRKNAWKVGLAGRLRRLKKKALEVGADRLKQIQARIAEIEQIYKDHDEKA